MRIWRIVCLALGGLRRRPLRVALTCLGVTIASGALVSMVAFALGLQSQAEAPFEKLGLLSNIEVRPGKGGDSEDSAALNDAALERMAAIPRVTLAYPDFRANDIKISHGERTRSGIAFGLPREAALFGVMEEILVAGEPFSQGSAPEVILGEPLARDLGFASPDEAVGSQLSLEATGLSPGGGAGDFTFQRKEFPVKVVGVYSLPQPARGFMGRGILLPIELIKEVPGIHFSSVFERLRAGKSKGPDGYQKVIVRVEHPSDLVAVEKEIRAMGFRTHTLLSDLEEMRKFFVFMDVLLASVGTVALVVAGLGIVNTLLMSVLERYQEIGICKAIGASDGDLLVLFLTEASIIGLIGGLGGLALGRAVSWVLEIGVSSYARTQGVDTPMDVFAFPAWLLAGTVLFSIAVAVLAGVYPAIRAARVDPIRALRAE